MTTPYRTLALPSYRKTGGIDWPRPAGPWYWWSMHLNGYSFEAQWAQWFFVWPGVAYSNAYSRAFLGD